MPNLEYSEWIDTITLILTVSGLILGFIYSQVLQYADDRADLIASLRDGKVRRLYQGGVNWLLRGLQKLYGNAESLKAFDVSLLLSYFYPFLFFILTYSYFDGTNLFSGRELLPADSLYRPYFFPILLISAVGIVFVDRVVIGRRKRPNDWGKLQLQYLGCQPNLAAHCWHIMMGLISALAVWSFSSGSFAFVLLGFCFGYIVGAAAAFLMVIMAGLHFGVGVGVGVGVGEGIFAFISASAFRSGGISAGAGIYAVIAAQQKDYGLSMTLAFFYLVLPLGNALLDWLSWWVSRWFLERTAQAPRVRVIVLDVVLDFGVAVLFMLALCLLLPAGAMLLDSLGWVDVKSGVPAQTGWQEYAVWARDDPWGKGIMVTLMLVTTLIPTLLHILLGLMAFFIHGFKGAALADFLEQPRRNWRDGIASLWMFGYGVLAVATLLAMYHVFQHFAQLSIAQWLYDFTGYFYDLP